MKKLFFLLLCFSLIYFSGCKCKGNDCPCDGDNCESELITTVELSFKDTLTKDSLKFVFRDPDGDGSNAPTKFDTIKLAANKTYAVKVTLLNESVTPTQNITTEIENEKNDHQFFYAFSGVNVSSIYKDEDTNTPPLPVGISTQWTTGAASSTNGTAQIILKHQPDGQKKNNQAAGDTDVDITFQTQIK